MLRNRLRGLEPEQCTGIRDSERGRLVELEWGLRMGGPHFPEQPAAPNFTDRAVGCRRRSEFVRNILKSLWQKKKHFGNSLLNGSGKNYQCCTCYFSIN